MIKKLFIINYQVIKFSNNFIFDCVKIIYIMKNIYNFIYNIF